MDKNYFADQFTPPDQGPMERRLETFGPILPLVFGAFAEVNKAFDQLINDLAKVGAGSMYRSMLLKSPIQAKGVLVWKLRQRIGTAIHRANAEMLLARVPQIGARAAANAERQQRAQRNFFGFAGPSSATYAHTRSQNSWLFR